MNTDDEALILLRPWVEEQLKHLEECIHDQLEALNDWLYKRLENAYEDLTSEECALEHLRVLVFDEDGEEVIYRAPEKIAV